MTGDDVRTLLSCVSAVSAEIDEELRVDAMNT
jgi:hypothetical protein